MNQENQIQLLEKIKYIISEHDTGEAVIFLKEFLKKNPALGLPDDLILRLKIIALPSLSDEEVAEILKFHYLESFNFDIDFKGQLTAKLFSLPYSERDILRKKLQNALTQNNQKIGSLSIMQWVQEFEKSPNKNKKPSDASINFVSTNPKAIILTPIEKRVLTEMLYTYAYLLVATIPATEPTLSKILNIPIDQLQFYSSEENKGGPGYSRYSQKKTSSMIVNLPISEALENYPEIGEQLITSNRLKLKSFPEPARPSIKNWLSDYTFNLGFSSHSAMDRGTYLFRNENARVLNSLDRERLSFILKAYDENTPVDININTKQIMFPRRETRINEQRTIDNNQQSINSKEQVRTNTPQFQVPQRKISEIYNRQEQSNQPQDIFEKTKAFTEKATYPVQDSIPQARNLNFSSPQRLASEKQNQQLPKRYSPNPQSIISKPSAPINNVPPGNVVNLKDSK